MKNRIFLSIIGRVAIFGSLMAPSAHALSCLPVDMYLKDIVGKEEVVIVTGKATDQMAEESYTREVVTVTDAHQGYVEDKIFVYHEKSIDWGYYCNQGPGKKGDEGLYVMTRDAHGKYMVHQRLALTDPLIAVLKTNLEAADVTGEITPITKTDRMNQIMTTITDLFRDIQILFKEYLYWKAQ